MSVLIAAMGVVSGITVVNLLFCFGIVRRLRQHTAVLEGLAQGDGSSFDVMLAPGETIRDFSVRSLDGEWLTPIRFTASTLVGFFSTTCKACVDRLPQFVEFAAEHPGGRDHVLTVVVSDDNNGAAPMVDDLVGVSRVVQQATDGPLVAAFGVKGYPVFSLIDPGGLVRSTGIHVAALSPTKVEES